MNHIILIEHRSTYRAIYGLNLFLYLGVKVHIATTIKEVIDLVNSLDAKFVFIDNTGYSQDMAKKCYYALDSANKKVNMFIVGKTALNEGEFHIFDSNTGIKIILQSLAKYLNVTAKDMSQLEVGEYFPIPLDLLVPGWICPKSIYKNASQGFEEILIPDCIVTENFLDSLVHLDIDTLYVKASERLQFVNSLTLQLGAILNNPNTSLADRIDYTATAHQVVMEQARHLGISESTMKMAHDCIDSMIMLTREIKDLEHIMNDFFKNDQTYMYKHCFLANYIGTHLIKKMSWSSKDQHEKFSFICFFHDISLRSDEYVKIHTNEEIDKLNVSNEVKKHILNHALNSAKIISAYPKIPFGVDTIIKQHHGSKTGEGFDKIYKDLSPLACIFILAEEWASFTITSWESEKVIKRDSCINHLTKKYNNQAFGKIIPFLNDLSI